MLSALPAARRPTGEIDDYSSKVVQMHQDGAALRIYLCVMKSYTAGHHLFFCLINQPFSDRKVSVDAPGTIATALASSCDIAVVRSAQPRTRN